MGIAECCGLEVRAPGALGNAVRGGAGGGWVLPHSGILWYAWVRGDDESGGCVSPFACELRRTGCALLRDWSPTGEVWGLLYWQVVAVALVDGQEPQ